MYLEKQTQKNPFRVCTTCYTGVLCVASKTGVATLKIKIRCGEERRKLRTTQSIIS